MLKAKLHFFQLGIVQSRDRGSARRRFPRSAARFFYFNFEYRPPIDLLATLYTTYSVSFSWVSSPNPNLNPQIFRANAATARIENSGNHG